MNLLAYIQGKRKGKEAHRIEREAMRDPFLADALDGFDTVEGSHAECIAGIRTRLSASKQKSNKKIVYISIAASLLLCVSIGGYFFMNKDERSLVAQSEMSAIEKDKAEEVVPEAEAEENKQVEEIPESFDERAQNDIEERRDRASRDASPPPPPVTQREQAVIADDVIDIDEAEIQLPEIAAADIPQPNEDSLMIAQKADTKQPSKLTTPSSGAGQRAMTSTASGKPEPKIGMKAYKKYLKDSMIRPETGECAKKKGEVILEFKINAEGRPHNIEFRKKLCADLDKEAIRLIENGSVWVGDTSKSVILEVKF
ncbi:MAG: hypothetical protein LBV72_00300 [Tannerella sp.]|jgi:outer membrane biosynthesis protein TonB|nr:hypothetical protein [Tannerella sp.]